MIKFDPAQVSFDLVMLKAVTTSLGGSISIVDTSRSTDKKEVLKRVAVPMAIARSFIMRHKKVTRYLKPVPTAIVRYGNHVIALERHPLGALGKIEDDGLFGHRRWIPDSENNFMKYIAPTVANNERDWFFDGRYVYMFADQNVEAAIDNGVPLTTDGCFRKVEVTAIDLQDMHLAEKLNPAERTCLAYQASNGMFAVSPPVWKDLSDVGSTQLKKAGLSVNEMHAFEGVDDNLSVNINFVLKAGQELGSLFGYEVVEPLQLPRLMVELHTVNLPNVSQEIKATYDTGLKFSHTMAWLLGLTRRIHTLDAYITMRSLMKFLTSKGMFRNNIFNEEQVFKDGMTLDDVKQINVDEIKADTVGLLSLGELVEQIKMSGKRKKQGIASIGTMMTEGDE